MAEQRRQGGWLANLSIRRKLLLAFGAIIGLWLINFAANFLLIEQQIRERARSDQADEAMNEIAGFEAALRFAQSELRGYVITTDTKYIGGIQNAIQQFDAHFARMRELMADDPAQVERLNKMDTIIVNWRRDFNNIDLTKVPSDAGQRELFRDIVIGPHTEQVTADFTALLQAMSKTERDRLVQIDARLHELETRNRLLAVIALVLGVLVVLASIRAASRLLVQPVAHMTGLMTRLAEHDHSIDVKYQERGDEIGAIARALSVFRQTAIESFDSNWVKTRVADISAKLQRAGGRHEFADVLMSELAPLLGAPLGLFYGVEEGSGNVNLLGSYGLPPERRANPSHKAGAGLVDQCARDRRSIVVENVPADYAHIGSGVGAARPRAVILLPLPLLDRLLGVIEFASFGGFSAQQQKLLDELLPFVALSLDNLNRARHTQQLLAHTQAQASELQTSEENLRVQQEELTATNEELHGKTTELQEHAQRLRASEEELRVQAEELQASNEELRQKTETLNEQKQVLESLQRDTEHKAEALARASQYKSDFLANMSHELRTPLNSLLILSRNLADNETGNLDASQIESARVIHESGSNLLRLINDILDLSKIEAGKMEVVAENISLPAFGHALTRSFRHVAVEKGLEFEVALDRDLPARLHTDGARLEQIVNNLLSNAFKFTAQGAVRVRIARPTLELAQQTGLRAEEAVGITVSDTGIGIPQDKLDHIFGTFEQMDAGTSRKYGGSGLGLSIARRLAELLGGGIAVTSAVREGSTFTVVLPESAPVAPVAAETAAPAPPPPPSYSAGPFATDTSDEVVVTGAAPWIPDDRDAIGEGDTVILVIEDDAVFARTLVEMIRRKGYRALAAGDGESGLFLARQHRPTGILLDVMLPGMDGWAVIARLKQGVVTRHIPVHFVSAVDETARARALGAVGFLTKPVQREAVLTAFERLLHFSEGSTRQVLLVDDDEDSRLAISSLIKSNSVNIVEVTSAEEALEKLDQGTYDCIVLDLGLPGMSGFDFLEIITARGPVPPVVIHSGRELSREESAKLRQYTDSIVIKGTRSLERLLDEVSLFLHSMRKSAGAHVVRDIDSSLSGRTVLIVDDDMRNIFALSKILRQKGLSVIMAQDGHKALRQLEENRSIEIVLMDIMMPGMDGYETTRAIRERPAHAKLPIIAVTAKAMSGDRDKCLAAGANDYLAKPIDVDKLLSMMRVWLQS